jgi:DNA transformation protein and related proteins
LGHERLRILDRLASLGEVTSRPMFGGHGFYWRGVIFAISYRERLYLKVNDQSRPAFEALGMGPFRPNDRQTLKSYYEVPQIVLDDTEELLAWAGEAIRAAQESQGPVA